MQTRPAAGLAASMPCVVLGQFPTPLDAAPRLSAALGGPTLWIKREDLSGLALGGNKTRQLEALMGATLAEGADTVVTTAAAQSNFCRTVAAAAAKLGLNAVLLLRGDPTTPVTGNLLLDQLFGAEIEFVDTTDPYDPAVLRRLDAILDRLRAAGRVPKLLHVVGAAGALGAASYVPTAEELARQFVDAGIDPVALYVTAGSGLTVAGLALGLKHLRSGTRVVGVCAQTEAAVLHPLIVRRANEASALLGLGTTIVEGDIELDDQHIGTGYGVASAAGIEAMELAARKEGLVLDPVYTGKCMAGLIAHVRAGRWRAGETVIFLHSGGAPRLFAYGAEGLAAARGVVR
ncbi:MAG TPA: D-cysteine desulfhydrase family protein [Acetobacteraceae bacterium]|nr:D-cysteine desulfhydrase family protein [Acetobacteraceae bacterium]